MHPCASWMLRGEQGRLGGPSPPARKQEHREARERTGCGCGRRRNGSVPRACLLPVAAAVGVQGEGGRGEGKIKTRLNFEGTKMRSEIQELARKALTKLQLYAPQIMSWIAASSQICLQTHSLKAHPHTFTPSKLSPVPTCPRSK